MWLSPVGRTTGWTASFSPTSATVGAAGSCFRSRHGRSRLSGGQPEDRPEGPAAGAAGQPSGARASVCGLVHRRFFVAAEA